MSIDEITGDEQYVAIKRKDLYCIAKMMQSMESFKDGNPFHCCDNKHCKHAADCAVENNRLANGEISEPQSTRVCRILQENTGAFMLGDKLNADGTTEPAQDLL